MLPHFHTLLYALQAAPFVDLIRAGKLPFPPVQVGFQDPLLQQQGWDPMTVTRKKVKKKRGKKSSKAAETLPKPAEEELQDAGAEPVEVEIIVNGRRTRRVHDGALALPAGLSGDVPKIHVGAGRNPSYSSIRQRVEKDLGAWYARIAPSGAPEVPKTLDVTICGSLVDLIERDLLGNDRIIAFLRKENTHRKPTSHAIYLRKAFERVADAWSVYSVVGGCWPYMKPVPELEHISARSTPRWDVRRCRLVCGRPSPYPWVTIREFQDHKREMRQAYKEAQELIQEGGLVRHHPATSTLRSQRQLLWSQSRLVTRWLEMIEHKLRLCNMNVIADDLHRLAKLYSDQTPMRGWFRTLDHNGQRVPASPVSVAAQGASGQALLFSGLCASDATDVTQEDVEQLLNGILKLTVPELLYLIVVLHRSVTDKVSSNSIGLPHVRDPVWTKMCLVVMQHAMTASVFYRNTLSAWYGKEASNPLHP